MSSTTERIEAAVEDGRAQSPRFKQRQLAALHEALKQNQTAITTAVEKDSKCSAPEANAQYYLTLDAVKNFYDNPDFEKLLEDEYKVAHQKDNPNRRSAIGCVNVIPDASSLLYSAVVASAAAIAAGNCVMLEIKQTLSELSSLLRKVLSSALDNDTFGIVETNTLAQDFKAKHCCVLDCSKGSTRSVAAIVDRSGDHAKAAKELVDARMSFAGKSRYAPDLVLVNEYCMEQFCKAAMQAALPYLASSAASGRPVNGHVTATRKLNTNDKNSVVKEVNAVTLSSGDGGFIALARDRTDKLLSTKIGEPLLLIHPISSLDDAIDFVNTSSKEPLQALYLFSAPPAAKYLSQFVKADISFTNHIPIELLLGSVPPRTASLGTESINSLKAEVHPRFTPEMFSIPRPEYANPARSPISEHLTALLQDGKQQSASIVSKLSQATQLKPLNEPQGGGIGFFEQGIITGGTLLLSTIVGGTAIAVRYGYPYLVRMLRRS